MILLMLLIVTTSMVKNYVHYDHSLTLLDLVL